MDKYVLKIQVVHLCSEDIAFFVVSVFGTNYMFMEYKISISTIISLGFSIIKIIMVK